MAKLDAARKRVAKVTGQKAEGDAIGREITREIERLAQVQAQTVEVRLSTQLIFFNIYS